MLEQPEICNHQKCGHPAEIKTRDNKLLKQPCSYKKETERLSDQQ